MAVSHQTLRHRITGHPIFPELLMFAVVGGSSYALDLVLFNILRGGMGIAPLPAKAVSLSAAVLLGFVGNRYWTYRDVSRRAGARGMGEQGLMFFLCTFGGMVIQMAFLGFSHYVLGLTSLLADNISGNLIGMAAATVFRFWGYRTWVFRAARATAPVPGPGVPPVSPEPRPAQPAAPAEPVLRPSGRR